MGSLLLICCLLYFCCFLKVKGFNNKKRSLLFCSVICTLLTTKIPFTWMQIITHQGVCKLWFSCLYIWVSGFRWALLCSISVSALCPGSEDLQLGTPCSPLGRGFPGEPLRHEPSALKTPRFTSLFHTSSRKLRLQTKKHTQLLILLLSATLQSALGSSMQRVWGGRGGGEVM